MALRCLWEVFRDIGFVLWPLRMIILSLIVCGAALLAVPQAQEIVVKLAQDNNAVDWLFFASAATWLAVNAWYWGRFITGFLTVLPFDRLPFERCGTPQCGGTPLFGGQAARIKFLTAHLPRVLGFAVLITIAVALWIASTILPDSETVARENLKIAYISFGVAAFVFYALVWRRRALALRLRSLGLRAAIPAAPPALTSIRDLPLVLGFSAAISLTVFIASWIAPVTTAAILGSSAILFLAATAWIAFGTLLVYSGQATGLPIIGTIAAVAFASSLFPDRGIFRDNHDVRLLESALKGRSGPSEAITPYYETWAAKPRAETSPPVIIVATAGGGIRAAYWTATVLGELTDRSQRNAAGQVAGGADRPVMFDTQLFAISGVSGGSLGAAVYRSLLIERTKGGKTCISDGLQQSFSFTGCGQAALTGDFLGPTLAAALFPDLTQRIFPFAIFSDRAEALEKAWETSWQAAMGSDRLGDDFLSNGGSEAPLPALLLNGTSVANGRRLITASFPLDITRSDGSVWPVLPEVIDFVDDSGSTVRLSTAVNNSARFSWVGPAGTIRKPDGGIVDRVVDGGYFENFGATTAIDLIRWLDGNRKLGEKRRNLITILISSDPELYSPDATNCGTEPGVPANTSERGREVLTPVITLLHTREARGSYAADELRDLTQDGQFFHFRLLKQTDIRDAPLGWTLSKRAQEAIRNSWSACRNSETMRRLAEKLHWSVL